MTHQEKNLSSLLEHLRQDLPKLKEEYSIETLEVFGSYVRGEEQTTSDLDLLITFSELPSLFKYIEIENRLSDLLGVKVDLVMKDALKPAIGKRVLNEAVEI
ncbi:MAG: nucleotidyltransferase family protein [Anaerolineales bacterium]|nr:nucleotidyltransferase family protein [Anaerolineales bacterium]